MSPRLHLVEQPEPVEVPPPVRRLPRYDDDVAPWRLLLATIGWSAAGLGVWLLVLPLLGAVLRWAWRAIQ